MNVRVAVAAVLLCSIAVFFVFHPFAPALPRAGIDPSWVAVMGEAADRPARWGVDTVFTYGPASPLVTGYLNAGFFTHTLPLFFGFAALFGWCGALLVAGDRATATTGTLALALMTSAARGTPDALFLSLPLLICLLALRPFQRGSGTAASLGAFAMGLSAMVKMSFPLAALPLFLLADAVNLGRHRRIPRLLPLFALGVVAGALFYGQRLTDLPAYVLGQSEVVAGYAAAMAMDGPDWDLAAFLIAAAVLVATTALSRRDPDRWSVCLALAVALLFLFKAGFIRHDLHSMISWTGLAMIATVLAWSRLPRRPALAVTAAACVVVLVYAPLVTVRQSTRTGRGTALIDLYRGWLVDTPRGQVRLMLAALRDPTVFRESLHDAKTKAWATIAAAAPLEPLVGTVDILPSDQTRVLASGLAYRGRPSFQEYSTYTEGLAEANRTFLESPRAPHWILFGPESPLGFMAIDERYPSLAEGSLWPDLLRLYRPANRIGSLVALERRPAPAPLHFGPARDLVTGFDSFTAVGADGPLWATLDPRLNAIGRVLSALFRPPLLTLAVRLDDGSERRFRLVPALAAAGFLLSPLVDNASDYQDLAANRPVGAARRVTALAVEVSRWGRLFYAADIAMTLQALDLTGLIDEAPPRSETTAWDVLGAGGGESRVEVPAAGVLTLPLRDLPVAGGARHVALAAGVGEGSGPVCFSAYPADGTRKVLWQDCTKPDATASKSLRSMSIDVPDGVTELTLETACGGARCEAFWTAPATTATPP